MEGRKERWKEGKMEGKTMEEKKVLLEENLSQTALVRPQRDTKSKEGAAALVGISRHMVATQNRHAVP